MSRGVTRIVLEAWRDAAEAGGSRRKRHDARGGREGRQADERRGKDVGRRTTMGVRSGGVPWSRSEWLWWRGRALCVAGGEVASLWAPWSAGDKSAGRSRQGTADISSDARDRMSCCVPPRVCYGGERKITPGGGIIFPAVYGGNGSRTPGGEFGYGSPPT